MKASLAFWPALAFGCGGFLFAQPSAEADKPITGGGRIEWATMTTISLPSMGAGVLSSSWGEAFHQPREYGVTLRGFGQRLGQRFAGVSVSNTMEAGLGAVWGEDPRYRRVAEDSFGHRVGNVLKMSVMAYNSDGRLAPAYARYAAIGGSNFLSNAWRPDSDATIQRATIRVGLGFLGRLASNSWIEFWPDVHDHFLRPKPEPPDKPGSRGL